MQTGEIKLSGAVVFWNCAVETDVRKLQDGLDAIGEGTFLPGERTPFAALKRAAAKLWRGEGFRVVNLKDRAGVTVEAVKYGETDNEYTQVAYATLNADETAVDVVYCRSWETKVTESEWRDAADYELNLCSANAVGAALAKVVDAVEGHRLRPTGGVYFVPEWSLQRFSRIAAVYESAGIGGSTMVHRLEVAKGDQTIRSVHATITERIRERVAAMRQDLAGGLQKLGRQNRIDEVKELKAKAGRYEALLEESLADVRAELSEIETQLGMESIAASANLFAQLEKQESEDAILLVA